MSGGALGSAEKFEWRRPRVRTGDIGFDERNEVQNVHVTLRRLRGSIQLILHAFDGCHLDRYHWVTRSRTSIRMPAISEERLTLNNGTSIPAVGVGCWMGVCGEGEQVTEMVKTALELGYRHVDTVECCSLFRARLHELNRDRRTRLRTTEMSNP
ncbi:hypothetical protein EVJ58_g272 [Rhodofomes roseus]|uniref:NADP-dependent oxidoreductase domain-containing protein n=1 Tax=Rhodofomes roseus TaxID=34475 RepID=A0A4Y9Z5D5_9APHY|nr:hypothetical protein EVJ58_g272 [Rhodofomes roseus]